MERGPVVYCAEWPDNDFDVLSVFMNRTPQFEVVALRKHPLGDELRTSNL